MTVAAAVSRRAMSRRAVSRRAIARGAIVRGAIVRGDGRVRRRGHPAAGALVVALILVGCVLLQVARPAPAAAHNYLVSSTPSDGAVLDTAPSEVTLEFNGPVGQKFATVVVAGADGTTFQSGAPRVVGGTVTQRLRPIAEAGTYRVAWRVVSSDGHPISGTFEFRLRTGDATAGDGTPSPESATSPSGTVSAPSTAPSGATSARQAAERRSDGAGAGWLLAGGAAVAVLAAGAVVVVRRRSGTRDV